MRIELVREHGPALGIEGRREAGLALIKEPGDLAKSEKVSQPVRRNDLDFIFVLAHRPIFVLSSPGVAPW